jgi:hypothetical protein
VEVDFYRNVQSKHIPEVYYINSDGDRHWLLLEDVAGHHPAGPDYGQALDLARRAREIICGINPVKTFRHNLSGDHYNGFVESTVSLLRKLHSQGKLKTVGAAVTARIAEAMSHPDVLRAVHNCGSREILHGDLKYDNILIRPDGSIVIIDWQNIMIGPGEIDTYKLMATQGIDPVPIAGIGPEILRMALEIRWFADCLDRWMPYPDFLDSQIAKVEKHMRHVVENNGYAGMEVYHF